MQPVKETAYNIAASAKSGLDKTKAVAQEKMERMTANNPTEKEIATDKKEQRIQEAELNKQNMREAAHSGGGTGTYSHSTTGTMGQSTGAQQMSALPGHGTGQPTGQVVEGTIKSHPIGRATGTQRSTTAHNTHAGGGTGYGTGGGYTG